MKLFSAYKKTPSYSTLAIVMIGDDQHSKEAFFNHQPASGQVSYASDIFKKKKFIRDNKHYLFGQASGQEKYRQLIASYVKLAHCIGITLDMNQTPDEIKQRAEYWIKFTKDNNTMSGAGIFFVATGEEACDAEKTAILTALAAQHNSTEHAVSVYNTEHDLWNFMDDLYQQTETPTPGCFC